MRPVLTPEEAERFRRDEVLRYTGPAGSERIDPWAPPLLSVAGMQPDYIVDPAGPLPSLQAAIDQVVRDQPAHALRQRLCIGLVPGRHAGLGYLPKLHIPLTICGLGAGPEACQIVETIDAEMTGTEYSGRFARHFAQSPSEVTAIFRRIAARDTVTTANASVLRVEADDVQLVNLTLRNSYNADRAQPESSARNAAGQFTTGQHQAVALLVAGADRFQAQDLHLRSYQDTLYLQSPQKGSTVRASLRGCDIEGDVDFIFGQSTAWFEDCTLRSLGARAPQTWVTAPSTDLRTRFGFVFNGCRFEHDGAPNALSGSFSLGRQWFEGVRATPYGLSDVPGYFCQLGRENRFDPPRGQITRQTFESVGKCVILQSELGAHLNPAAPWDDWNGGRWDRSGRYTRAPWHPRFRPAQYRGADFLRNLSGWLDPADQSYADIDPKAIYLAEFDNRSAANRP